jgi:hypothetical protein
MKLVDDSQHVARCSGLQSAFNPFYEAAFMNPSNFPRRTGTSFVIALIAASTSALAESIDCSGTK